MTCVKLATFRGSVTTFPDPRMPAEPQPAVRSAARIANPRNMRMSAPCRSDRDWGLGDWGLMDLIRQSPITQSPILIRRKGVEDSARKTVQAQPPKTPIILTTA